MSHQYACMSMCSGSYLHALTCNRQLLCIMLPQQVSTVLDTLMLHWCTDATAHMHVFTGTWCRCRWCISYLHTRSCVPLLLLCTYRHMQSGSLPIRSTTCYNLLTIYQRWDSSGCSNDIILFDSLQHATFMTCATILAFWSITDIFIAVILCEKRLLYWWLSLLAFVTVMLWCAWHNNSWRLYSRKLQAYASTWQSSLHLWNR
jgi:hypothetical protein